MHKARRIVLEGFALGRLCFFLVDRDSDDCHALKRRLETIAREAGLVTKAATQGQGLFHVATRIAIEELEAWYMGDIDALKEAFSSLNSTLSYFPTPPPTGFCGSLSSPVSLLNKSGELFGCRFWL
ncbi:DUF4276 family protein, partial [Thiolapillus sp.]|uniref:DUF4276 family protein n=1 Tax=Thiolapillus sp. TaxID=2017437 RepID=UPI003AF45B92